MARFQHLHDLICDYLPIQDEEFGFWAFGSSFDRFVGGLDFMEAWNILHGEKLKLDPSGDMKEDVKKMIEIWKEEKP